MQRGQWTLRQQQVYKVTRSKGMLVSSVWLYSFHSEPKKSTAWRRWSKSQEYTSSLHLSSNCWDDSVWPAGGARWKVRGGSSESIGLRLWGLWIVVLSSMATHPKVWNCHPLSGNTCGPSLSSFLLRVICVSHCHINIILRNTWMSVNSFFQSGMWNVFRINCKAECQGDYYKFGKITLSQPINILWPLWGSGFGLNEGIQWIND